MPTTYHSLRTVAALSCTLLVAGRRQLGAQAVSSAPPPVAVTTDPPHDAQHPARMAVLHIPSGDVRINGVAYLAAGGGAHPTFVLLHGLPGNEKNLDLAQAVRRAGWHAITLNYRGSWGSPGTFRFAHTLDDAAAVLAYLRDTATVRTLGIDTTRLVLAGHSMGGWATAHTAAHDGRLRGAVLISAADMGAEGVAGATSPAARARLVAGMSDNMESLAGVSAAEMADELIAHGDAWRLARVEAGLARVSLLVLTSDDGLAPQVAPLVAAARAAGNTRVTTQHVATDHGWSDRRIALETAVVQWLETMR